jgi:hypothetical protein
MQLEFKNYHFNSISYGEARMHIPAPAGWHMSHRIPKSDDAR